MSDYFRDKNLMSNFYFPTVGSLVLIRDVKVILNQPAISFENPHKFEVLPDIRTEISGKIISFMSFMENFNYVFNFRSDELHFKSPRDLKNNRNTYNGESWTLAYYIVAIRFILSQINNPQPDFDHIIITGDYFESSDAWTAGKVNQIKEKIESICEAFSADNSRFDAKEKTIFIYICADEEAPKETDYTFIRNEKTYRYTIKKDSLEIIRNENDIFKIQLYKVPTNADTPPVELILRKLYGNEFRIENSANIPDFEKIEHPLLHTFKYYKMKFLTHKESILNITKKIINNIIHVLKKFPFIPILLVLLFVISVYFFIASKRGFEFLFELKREVLIKELYYSIGEKPQVSFNVYDWGDLAYHEIMHENESFVNKELIQEFEPTQKILKYSPDLRSDYFYKSICSAYSEIAVATQNDKTAKSIIEKAIKISRNISDGIYNPAEPYYLQSICRLSINLSVLQLFSKTKNIEYLNIALNEDNLPVQISDIRANQYRILALVNLIAFLNIFDNIPTQAKAEYLKTPIGNLNTEMDKYKKTNQLKYFEQLLIILPVVYYAGLIEHDIFKKYLEDARKLYDDTIKNLKLSGYKEFNSKKESYFDATKNYKEEKLSFQEINRKKDEMNKKKDSYYNARIAYKNELAPVLASYEKYFKFLCLLNKKESDSQALGVINDLFKFSKEFQTSDGMLLASELYLIARHFEQSELEHAISKSYKTLGEDLEKSGYTIDDIIKSDDNNLKKLLEKFDETTKTMSKRVDELFENANKAFLEAFKFKNKDHDPRNKVKEIQFTLQETTKLIRTTQLFSKAAGNFWTDDKKSKILNFKSYSSDFKTPSKDEIESLRKEILKKNIDNQDTSREEKKLLELLALTELSVGEKLEFLNLYNLKNANISLLPILFISKLYFEDRIYNKIENFNFRLNTEEYKYLLGELEILRPYNPYYKKQGMEIALSVLQINPEQMHKDFYAEAIMYKNLWYYEKPESITRNYLSTPHSYIANYNYKHNLTQDILEIELYKYGLELFRK